MIFLGNGSTWEEGDQWENGGVHGGWGGLGAGGTGGGVRWVGYMGGTWGRGVLVGVCVGRGTWRLRVWGGGTWEGQFFCIFFQKIRNWLRARETEKSCTNKKIAKIEQKLNKLLTEFIATLCNVNAKFNAKL